MKNKVITTAIIAALITSQTATVFGASLSNVGDTQSRETLASFDATASDLGGVIVSVPEKMALTKDSNDTFKDSDYVTAYGQIGADVRLRVTASESIEYTNKDVEDAAKVTGTVDFGTKYWSSDELFQGYKDHDNAVKNAVTISIADMSSMQPGEYDGSVPFEIQLESIRPEPTDESAFTFYTVDENGRPTDADMHYTVPGCSDKKNYAVILGLTEKGKTLDTIVIPDTYDNLPVLALYGNNFSSNSVKEIIVPETVEYLGQGIFASCPKLQSIFIPKSVNTVDECGVGGCNKFMCPLFSGDTYDNLIIYCEDENPVKNHPYNELYSTGFYKYWNDISYDTNGKGGFSTDRYTDNSSNVTSHTKTANTKYGVSYEEYLQERLKPRTLVKCDYRCTKASLATDGSLSLQYNATDIVSSKIKLTMQFNQKINPTWNSEENDSKYELLESNYDETTNTYTAIINVKDTSKSYLSISYKTDFSVITDDGYTDMSNEQNHFLTSSKLENVTE